jgi:hypothetical protein
MFVSFTTPVLLAAAGWSLIYLVLGGSLWGDHDICGIEGGGSLGKETLGRLVPAPEFQQSLRASFGLEAMQ